MPPVARVRGALAGDLGTVSGLPIGSSASGPFGGRGGGAPDDPVADAVEHALRWLAAHQSPDGGWEAAGWSRWCDGKPAEGGAEGRGKSVYDPGVTGLALLAFLGAGYTNRGDHAFAKTVSKGLRYLKNVQDPEGCFGPRTAQHHVYNHAMAALAMVEAYGMTGSPIFKGSAQKALDFVALARNPHLAWRYGVKPGDDDTSITAWMVASLLAARSVSEHAVRSGRGAPLRIDDEAFAGTLTWLDHVTDPSTGRVGYIARGAGSARPQELVDRFPTDRVEAMTAAAVAVRLALGASPTDPSVAKGLGLLLEHPPRWNASDGSIDMTYWFHGSLAAHRAGDTAWHPWSAALRAAVLPNQRLDTDYCRYRGSWDPIDPWGPDGGRVYATAILALALETSGRDASPNR
jgi:hypothetical protein